MSRVVELAIECTEAINMARARGDFGDKGDDVVDSYLQRTRRFHTDVVIGGVAHVVAIAAARSSAEVVSAGLRVEKCAEIVGYVAGAVKDGRLGREEAGYALYGAILLHGLKRVGYVYAGDFAGALRELRAGRGVNLVAYRFAEWLKRLAEAYFKKE